MSIIDINKLKQEFTSRERTSPREPFQSSNNQQMTSKKSYNNTLLACHVTFSDCRDWQRSAASSAVTYTQMSTSFPWTILTNSFR